MNPNWAKYFSDEKIIAVDPGKAGGIAILSKTRNELIEVEPMPETPQDLLKFFTKYQKNSVCYLERVQGIPGMAASAMFNFGQGFGQVEMALLCRNIPTIEITPQKWQKELQLGVKGHNTTNEWKTKLKARAQQIYPKVEKEFSIKNKTMWLKVSDALLILEYARRMEGNKK